MCLLNFFQIKHSVFLQTLYRDNWIWKVKGLVWEVANTGRSYPSKYQNVTEVNLIFCDKEHSISSKFYYLEPGIYLSITDMVESMNTLNQARHIEICITVQMSRTTQKDEIYLANEGSGLAFFTTDLGHFFESNVGKEVGVMLRRKGPHKPGFAYSIVRIHSLVIYTGLIEYNIAVDTKNPLLHCFTYISKLKPGDIKTTGQDLNYQTFINLYLRPLLENFS